MVAEANSNQSVAVLGAEVETIRRSFVAELFALKFHDLDDGFVHGGEHFRDGVLFFPGSFVAGFREVGHLKGGGVLRVSAAEDVDVGVVA